MLQYSSSLHERHRHNKARMTMHLADEVETRRPPRRAAIFVLVGGALLSAVVVLLFVAPREFHPPHDGRSSEGSGHRAATVVVEKEDAMMKVVSPTSEVGGSSASDEGGFTLSNRPEATVVDAAASSSSFQPAARYLFSGNTLGRHFNQLTTIVASIAFAARHRRTAIVPPFLMESKSGAEGRRGGGGSAAVPFDRLYALNADCLSQSGFDVMLEHEFVAGVLQHRLAKEKGKTRSTNDGGEGEGSNADVQVGCLTMKGTRELPRQPLGGVRLTCKDRRSVASKKVLADVDRAARALDREAYLHVPLLMYLTDALAANVSRIWGCIDRHPFVEALLRLSADGRNREGLVAKGPNGGDEANHNTSANADPRKKAIPLLRCDVGIHLRNMEGSCLDRSKAILRVDAPDREMHWKRLRDHCDITPDYVQSVVGLASSTSSRVRRGNREGDLPPTTTRSTWCVAHDGQDLRRVSLFEKYQRSLSAETPPAAAQVTVVILERLWTGLKSSILRAPSASSSWATVVTAAGGRAALDPSTVWSDAPSFLLPTFDVGVVSGVLFMQLDFWTLVDASGAFVGTQVSTVSMCVCRKRWSLSRDCSTFITDAAVVSN